MSIIARPRSLNVRPLMRRDTSKSRPASESKPLMTSTTPLLPLNSNLLSRIPVWAPEAGWLYLSLKLKNLLCLRHQTVSAAFVRSFSIMLLRYLMNSSNNFDETCSKARSTLATMSKQHCRSDRQLCCHRFDNVAVLGNNVEATFDFDERTKFQRKTRSTLLPFLATKSNVASTVLPKTATIWKQHSTL